jgi:protein-S-isoprenylcysteine O-methyltransferase Ste14
MAAFLFALPIGCIVLFIGAMGECMGDPNCDDSKRMAIVTNLAIVLAVAIAFGLSVRVMVRRARLRGTEAAPRAWAVALAFPIVFAMGLLAIWCVLAMFGVISI